MFEPDLVEDDVVGKLMFCQSIFHDVEGFDNLGLIGGHIFLCRRFVLFFQ